MRVSVENTSDLGRRLAVELPGEEIARKIDERLEALGSQVAVEGFRPGKAPPDVVRSKYGEHIRKEVYSEAIDESLPRALAEAQLEPVGEPAISIDHSLEDGVLRYSATFEVMPGIDVQPVEQIKLTRPLVEVTESDIDALIGDLRLQRVKWQSAQRPAQSGDRVTLDYQGLVEGRPIPGGEARGLQAVIGEKSLLPELEEQLVGMAEGDSGVVNVTLPDSFPDVGLRGREAEFRLSVLKVEAPLLPDLDDVFFRSFGVHEGGLEGFRNQVRRSMELELRQKIVGTLKAEMLDQLLAIHEVPVPETLVQLEMERLKSASDESGDEGGGEADLQSQARYRVSCGIILTALAKKLGISATAEQVREKIEFLAESYENPGEVVAWYYSSPEQMANVEAMVNEELLLEYVLEHGQVTDRKLSFSEMMDV